MACLLLPQTRAVRVIPDVHGMRDAFAARVDEARAQGRFIVQLGDVVDRGPDSAGALSLMLDLVEADEGAWVLGNHDWKLARALMGRPVNLSQEAQDSFDQINAVPGLAARFLQHVEQTPVFLRWGPWLFAHAAWDPAMTQTEPPSHQDRKRLEARALYGEVTGRRDALGRPIRIYDWVDRAPAGVSVVIGHDWRGDAVVLRRDGAGGAHAYLLDLGCGKGGPLAHADLEPPAACDGVAHAVFSHRLELWGRDDQREAI